MAQKDKVKELVGRGLNSYHTKALQQMDRIEKKNKEQNHKISILSNELDNDYLTKTEKGSVVSLEHSKEGMVYLDELQGNTLVNYCTDGSKELTLNGDIDVEGTFVTTTEGVDNGKVDVMCEGNTLVNLVKEGYATVKTISKTTSHNKDLLKPNTEYTLCFEVVNNNLNENSRFVIELHPSNAGAKTTIYSGETGYFVRKVTTYDIVNHTLWIAGTDGGSVDIQNYMILEGDWTNREIPQYFEGMKSVGQDDTNGHKIEILSSVGKENLIKDSNIYIEQSNTSKTFNSSYKNILDKVQNKTITISVDIEVEDMIPIANGKNRIGCELSVVYEDNTKAYHGIWYSGENFKGRQARTFSIKKRIKTVEYFGIYIQCAGKKHKIGRPKLEIGDTNTSWCPSSTDNLNGLQTFMNKKEILLNEPLRSLPNGVKDRIIKRNGQWMIERNCGEVVLDGSEDWLMREVKEKTIIFETNKIVNLSDEKNLSDNTINNVSNTIPVIPPGSWDSDEFGIHQMNVENIRIHMLKSKLKTQDIQGIKDWLSKDTTNFLYKLKTPIYEPLEIESVLNTYNDITHISNNSIIPCNMKIKNSGYNAIIKPSTLYTVALDTNNNGTIGMNLGGAKGTTTNNVLKLTTPATLADDSLRLYGKDINASKVRLLEGDKTNWIPSYFEGMKSSFEDKLQDDGTYKMEILSNNENLLILEKEPYFWRNSNKSIATRRDDKIIINGLVNQGWDAINLGYSSLLKSDTKYTITCKINQNMNVNHGVVLRYKHNGIIVSTSNYLWGGGNVNISKYTFTTPRISFDTIEVGYMVTWDGDKLTQTYTNLEFSEIGINEVYNPNKSNKIQFSSIEPLRGVGDIKDRFVFKDGKLMIERNVKELFLNNNYRLNELKDYEYTNTKLFEILPNENNYVRANGRSRLRCSVLPVDVYTKDYELFSSWDSSNKGFMVRLNKNIIKNVDNVKEWIDNRDFRVICRLAEPTYEEIPFELQKIILEGYENGTLFFDTNIPPTSTVTYAGETPIVKATKLNKTEVLNNTNDINDNIVPYLMDMDYRVVCLQLQSENINDGVSMARLFGGTYEMLQRDIQSRRYSVDEYKHRLDAYLDANKITEEEYNKLGDMLNE